MVDVFSKKKRSKVMAAIRSRGNKETEIRLLAIFKQRRITGWRRHLPMVGTPDFAFRTQRVAVFVDGCFWHGCPAHSRLPKSNQEYWRRKLLKNKLRDQAVDAELRRRGWYVVRLWQHDLLDEGKTAARVIKALRRMPKQQMRSAPQRSE